MRNKEKLSSDFNPVEDMYGLPSQAVLEKDDTEIDLYPDLLLDGAGGSLTVVIHHDYYSSDTEHGRQLLKGFLEVLKDEFNKISKIFIIDSGVCLLDSSNELNSLFTELSELDFNIVVCRESATHFGIDTSSYHPNVKLLSMHEIALELLSAPYLFNLG